MIDDRNNSSCGMDRSVALPAAVIAVGGTGFT